MFLTKDTTVCHVYDRAQFFLYNDPTLQDIEQDFTQEMISVEGIEVQGTTIGTDMYMMIQQLVFHAFRMLQQLAFHVQQTIQTTSVVDPHPCSDNDHVSVLPHEMTVTEPGENPTRTLTWKSLDFLNDIKCRTIDDRFPLPLWETFCCSSLGAPIPVLIGPPQQCVSSSFHYDTFGDHL